MTIELVNLQDLGSDEVDAFVGKHPNGMVYYTSRFRALIAKTLNCTLGGWACVEDNVIQGIFPLTRQEGPLGQVINSQSFYGSHGGPLAIGKKARNILSSRFMAEAVADGVACSMFVENPWAATSELDDVKGLVYLQDSRTSQMTPLPHERETREGKALALMKLFDSSGRRNIRKAKKAGVIVKVDNSARNYLQTEHVKSMTEIGGLAKTDLFFRALTTEMKADVDFQIYVAELEGTPIAALLILKFGLVIEYYVPVVTSEYRTVQAMSSILLEAMIDYSCQGYRWWNWGGTWESQGGVYNFKKKWGSVESSYKYHILVNSEKVFSATKKELLRWYPGFYVVPFDKLITP